eukprot:5647179-Pleurochrysis_carterae.AAC.1
MAALGVEWQQLAQARGGATEGEARGAGARGGVLAAAWLAGAGDDPALMRRRVTQLHMMGMAAATASDGGGVPARGMA